MSHTNERHREGSHAKHKDDGTSIKGDHATPHAPRAIERQIGIMKAFLPRSWRF